MIASILLAALVPVIAGLVALPPAISAGARHRAVLIPQSALGLAAIALLIAVAVTT